MNDRRLGIISLAAIVTSGAGCWYVPEERAELDEQVGIGAAGDLAVRVADGLASITRAAPGAVTLWAQAPVLRIELTSTASRVETCVLTIQNCFPDATIRGSTANGSPVEVVPRASPDSCRTQRTWSISVAPGDRAILELVPADVASRPLRFGVINDPHGADEIRSHIGALAADPQVAFVVSSGDISGGGTLDAMFRVQQTLCELGVPFYSTVGNADATPAWHDAFGRHSFHFQLRGVAFSFVDTASASIAPRVYEWLDGWMGEARTVPHVFVAHVPPLDPIGSRNAGFRSRNEAGKLLGKLAAGGVDLAIYGHLHNFHSLEEGGIPTVIAGGPGRPHVIVDVDPASGTTSTAPVWPAR